MKKKSIRFESGDLLIYAPEGSTEEVIYIILDRFSIPVGDEPPLVNRHFWNLFHTTSQKRISMYEKKMRHEVKKNPDWRLVKKNRPL